MTIQAADEPRFRVPHTRPEQILESLTPGEVREHLQALQSVTEAVLAHLTLPELLRELLSRLRSVLSVDAAAVLLCTEGRRTLVVRASKGLEEEVEQHVEIPVGQGITGAVAARRQAVIVDDVSTFETVSPLLQRLASMMVAPLLAGGDLLGVLHVGTFGPRHFTARDLYLLQVVADRVALAIRNALTYDQQVQAAERHTEVEAALRGSEARWRTLTEVDPNGIVVMDDQSIILAANPAVERILGYAADELVGQPMSVLIPERFRDAHRAGIERYLATGSRNIPWSGIELPALTRSGREIPVEIAFGEYVEGGQHVFAGFIQDLSSWKREEARRAAEHGVTRVLASNAPPEEIGPRGLEAVCEALGWDFGAFWAPDSASNRLRCHAVWHRGDGSLAGFAEASRATMLERGEGLPGRVWRHARALWIDDVLRDQNFPRVRAAAEVGLHAAFAVPVLVGGEVEGVMEFFAREIQEPDEALLGTMEVIGHDVGQYMRRRRAERDRDRALAEALEARDLAQEQAAQLEEAQVELELANDELQRANAEMERTQRVLRTTTENATSALILMDPEGRAIWWNPAWEEMTGFTRDEIEGERLHDLIHHTRPDGSPFPVQDCPIDRALPDGVDVRGHEDVFIRKDGAFFPVVCAAKPVWEDGRAVATVVEVRDVTEEKRAARRMRFLADLGQALQPLTDPGEVTATAARMLGEHLRVDRCAYADVEEDQDHFTIPGDYTRGDTISIRGHYAMADFGAAVLRLMRENQPYVVDDVDADERVTSSDRAAYEATQIQAVICVPLHKEGRFRAAMAVHQRAPRHWHADEVELVGTVAQRCWESIERARVLRELRESEARLRSAFAQAQSARLEAEEASRTKSAFLATMSHELRTPLNAISGYTDLLEMGIAGPVTEQQSHQLGRIKASSTHLLGLINEILDLAKVESGQMNVQRDRVPVAETVQEAVDLIGPQAAEQGIDLASHADSAPGAAYWGDGDRVRQILVNLLSNAVKFTPRGGRVSVSYHSVQDAVSEAALSGEGPWVAIDVEDTGIGIPPEQQRSIFDPFVQVDSTHTRERGGTGLGLTISQRLALLMGGSLTVRSEPGRGSCFTLWLPASSKADPVERRTWPRAGREIPRLAEVGHALARCSDDIVEDLGKRLRSDPDTPGASELDRAHLEDHTATFLTDAGIALVALDEADGEPVLMREGTEIQRTISHLHGAQRARLGWSEPAIRREFEILREITDRTLRRSLPVSAGQAVDEALEIVARLLQQAERVTLRGWRRAVRDTLKADEAP